MTATPPVSALAGFFQQEARECLAQAERAVDAGAQHGSERSVSELLRASRALRGSAAMTRLTAIAVLAGRVERIARSLHSRRLSWSPSLVEALRGALTELGGLTERVHNWTPEDEERAHVRAQALQVYTAATGYYADAARVIPIGALFHDDDGPHILFIPATPQTQFEQQLRELGGRSGYRTPPFASPSTATPPHATSIPTVTPSRQTPARGTELRSMLAQSLETMKSEAVPTVTGGSPGATGETTIAALLYRGRSAAARARALRASIEAERRAPNAEELQELMDLVDLAAS